MTWMLLPQQSMQVQMSMLLMWSLIGMHSLAKTAQVILQAVVTLSVATCGVLVQDRSSQSLVLGSCAHHCSSADQWCQHLSAGPEGVILTPEPSTSILYGSSQ